MPAPAENLQGLARRLAEPLRAWFVPWGGVPSWQAPVLLNGWAPYGDSFETPGYCKDALGFVHIKGVVKSGSTVDYSTIFVLPAGFRPPERVAWRPLNGASAGAGIIILTEGNVIVVSVNNTQLSLSGITFPAA